MPVASAPIVFRIAPVPCCCITAAMVNTLEIDWIDTWVDTSPTV